MEMLMIYTHKQLNWKYWIN